MRKHRGEDGAYTLHRRLYVNVTHNIIRYTYTVCFNIIHELYMMLYIKCYLARAISDPVDGGEDRAPRHLVFGGHARERDLVDSAGKS